MQSIILDKLEEIQYCNKVRILYAVESGSRGWGFASKDSDYDVRFIYIHPADWYLSIEEREDYIEVPINDLLDINGWDIKKALLQYKKSNPTLMEWLSSPIVYMENQSMAQSLRDLLPEYFSPVPAIYHYLHIARKKYAESISSEKTNIKRCFYILRPILACMWIEKFSTMPPMEFSRLMYAQSLDKSVSDGISELLERKISGHESDVESSDSATMCFLQSKIAYFEDYLKTVRKERMSGYESLNDLFRATLKETWGI